MVFLSLARPFGLKRPIQRRRELVGPEKRGDAPARCGQPRAPSQCGLRYIYAYIGCNPALVRLNQTRGAAGVFRESKPWNSRSRRRRDGCAIVHLGKNGLSSGDCTRATSSPGRSNTSRHCLLRRICSMSRPGPHWSQFPTTASPSSFSRMRRFNTFSLQAGNRK